MDNNTIIESGFMKKAVAGLVCALFPLASIVAIFLGAGNNKAIADYIASGGMLTPKIKKSAALSKGSIVAGIAMTVIYAIFIVLVILALSFAALLPDQQ